MKQSHLIFVLNIFLGSLLTASAQTKEMHIRLTSCHTQAMAYANNIQDNSEWSNEVFKNSYNETKMAYKNAILQYIELKKTLVKTEQVKAYMKSIEMHHMKAYEHYSEMKDELAKSSYDIDQVKKQAENFSFEMNHAEQVHQQLQLSLYK